MYGSGIHDTKCTGEQQEKSAPLYKALIPSSFTIVRNAVPMFWYFSFPPSICNRVLMTSKGVMVPAAIAPAMVPAIKLLIIRLWLIPDRTRRKLAYPGKNKMANGTSRHNVAKLPWYIPFIPNFFTTSMADLRCDSGTNACICIRIFTISMGFVAKHCIVPAPAPLNTSWCNAIVPSNCWKCSRNASLTANCMAFSGVTPTKFGPNPL